ncbi:MAG: hypothetical protein J6J27_02565 [Alphaproteobacteria bacterium]|nr:hypothetical protein [Alphaproteobacteria bacterium]
MVKNKTINPSFSIIVRTKNKASGLIAPRVLFILQKSKFIRIKEIKKFQDFKIRPSISKK